MVASAENGDLALFSNYKKGTLIWLPCSKNIWIKAVIADDVSCSAQFFKVQSDDGTEKNIPLNDFSPLPYLCNPDFLIDTNDLTTLSYLHEPDVLYSLKYRFDLGHIYTYCGIVLVAINPYRECDIYGENIFLLYRNANVRQLDPHVYGVAEEAFAYLTRHDRNQSIIISGESGAGKTVSAKYVMQYLAEACSVSSSKKRDSYDKDIEKRVLASNPVTEAFGNAKTVRNDNSSRFGKFIKLLFSSSQYSMCGATMETYLLEKSRLIYQNSNERNYHIFYQICCARNTNDLLKGLELDSPKNFRYLGKGSCLEVVDVDDSLKFVETLKALRLIGLNDDSLKQIFTILSAILHFGNVDFSASSSSDSCDISLENDHFAIFCYLLGLDSTNLRHFLLHKTLKAGGEILNRRLDSVQAENGRDSLAKLIYSLVFSWLIERINECLHKSNNADHENADLKFIGVLDIYGFEMFDKNSFEQLCINYANEMLQQQYNQHVFKLEQAEYVKEGIKWSFINFCDNQPCLDLFENRLGILDLLAQECKLTKASDPNFWNNISSRTNDTCSKSPYFHLPRINRAPGQFIVKHFAGDVVYDVEGFIEKNVDSVNVDQVEVLRNSKCSLLREILNRSSNDFLSTKDTTVTAKKCLASQFKQSLHELRKTLNATTPHYIRCIKPNDRKLSFNFCVLRTVEQLRACGVLETIRISASGFPSRWPYEEFYQRYRMLVRNKIGQNFRHFADAVCSKFLQSSKYEFGHTKIFFRTGQVALLETARTEKLQKSAITVQKFVRGFLARKRYLKIKSAISTIQTFGKAWLCYRFCKFLQMHRAAIMIQKIFKAHLIRSRYLKLRFAVIQLQRSYRLKVIRRERAEKLLNERIILLQSRIRGYLCRKLLQERLKSVILIQCCVRRWLARKLLKHLKMEAKSVQRLQNLNNGLENKVFSLQQQLDKIVLERNSLKSELEQMRKINENGKMSANLINDQAADQIFELESQLTVSRKLIGQLENKVAQMTNEMENFENEASTSRMILEKELCRLTDENLALKATLAVASNRLEPERPRRSGLEHNGLLNVANYDKFFSLIFEDFEQIFESCPVPCLRAFLIFMVIRNEDQRRKVDSITALLHKFYDTVTDYVMASSDFQLLTLWMSNVWRLMQLLRQYSGEEEYATQNTPSQSDDKLKNCDLCLQRSSFCDLLLIIYQKMIEEIFYKKLTPTIIVSSILEHHDSRNLSKIDRGGLINELNHIFDCFQNFGVEWPLCSQIFSHLFQYVEAHALNVLMSRRDLCNFSRSIEIKHSIKTLLNWLRDHNLSQNDDDADQDRNSSKLEKLFEATNLLQIRKSEPEDIKTLAAVCTHLNLAQVNKLLTAYSPTESFEPKLKPDFIRKTNIYLKNERNLDEKFENNELPWLRTVIKSSLNFPYVQSNLVLSEIDLPDALLPYIS